MTGSSAGPMGGPGCGQGGGALACCSVQPQSSMGRQQAFASFTTSFSSHPCRAAAGSSRKLRPLLWHRCPTALGATNRWWRSRRHGDVAGLLRRQAPLSALCRAALPATTYFASSATLSFTSSCTTALAARACHPRCSEALQTATAADLPLLCVLACSPLCSAGVPSLLLLAPHCRGPSLLHSALPTLLQHCLSILFLQT